MVNASEDIPARLAALSPLDGRYAGYITDLRNIGSEAGLIKYRVRIELHWLLQLAQSSDIQKELPAPDTQDRAWLLALEEDATSTPVIKAIEATTNHDVKAVEYWLKQQLANHSFWRRYTEFVHFGCTSEDINNLAYALMAKDLRGVLLNQLEAIAARLTDSAAQHAGLAMLSLTHGQPASPTTIGKESANVAARLNRQIAGFTQQPILGKFNGAVGNFNAHQIAWPEVDWQTMAKQTVTKLGLAYNPLTTQIEPHDWIAEYCHWLIRANHILIDLARDTWGYISRGLYVLALQEGETGSSTMPHKVNPIDFENAEGNLGMANALLHHLADTLPISRWQRDLSDSTVLRNLGSAVGYAAIGYHALLRGLCKIQPDSRQLAAELDNNPEILAEAIQTVMRRHGVAQPYEQLKAFTRGKKIDAHSIREFVDRQPIPEPAKKSLKALNPADYIGLAEMLSRSIT